MDPIPRGVLWEEGLFLLPHHLQQQALGALALSARHLGYAAPYRYGVAALDVDPLQLERGFFEARTLDVMLPSGEALVFDARGGGNAALAAREVPKGAASPLTIYVGVRRLRDHEPNLRESQDEDLDPPRYVRTTQTVADLTTGRNLQDVHFLKLNARLLFDGDRMDGFETVPIAQLVAPAVGLPPSRLASAWAPPSLRLSAAAGALALVKEIFSEAAGKAADLAGGASVADMIGGNATEAEVVQLWKLQVLRAALPWLREAADSGRPHPYDVYHMLCGLLGQFATLSAGASMPNMPLYDHANLGGCFEQVAKPLLALLRADQLAANFRRVPLTRGDLGIGGTAVGASGLDPELLNARNQIFLVFASPDAPGAERDFYRSGHVKVAAATRVANVVVQRKYGVPLAPCPKPRALPSRTRAVYYRLQNDASAPPEAQEEWRAVVKERTLVIHFATEGLVPGEAAPDLGMEAYVVFGR